MSSNPNESITDSVVRNNTEEFLLVMRFFHEKYPCLFNKTCTEVFDETFQNENKKLVKFVKDLTQCEGRHFLVTFLHHFRRIIRHWNTLIEWKDEESPKALNEYINQLTAAHRLGDSIEAVRRYNDIVLFTETAKKRFKTQLRDLFEKEEREFLIERSCERGV